MRKSFLYISIAILSIYQLNPLNAQKNGAPTAVDANKSLKLKDSLLKEFLNQVNFRQIGPATTSGRIIDLAINPENHSEYYVAAAYSGVWKTKNAGTTFEPIFDKYGTQSIGCLAMDPQNTHVIWVGTGENNNQRSVGYGNGIYKSTDGGKTFTNMGLKKSEHIGMIKINPTNSKDIWVAAYGPLWKEGGERGLYHSIDGGKTWNLAFKISDNTGCNEIHFDPFQAGVLYAAFHQRRRHEWTYLGGGPESALYKSDDNGVTWNKVGNGFPSGELGRITLGVSVKKGLLYAMVEASNDKGGIFSSSDHGASWSKVNSFTTAGNYYQEIITDPINPLKFYVMDMLIKVTEDGGKTLKNLGEPNKHVDNHTIWVDPSNGDHMLVGCDGGLYETFNHGKEWNFKDNLSITQFYRVSVDYATPFYNIYGGTQDNNSLGGPSRTNSANGIGNPEWFVTVGGDGFKSQIDPTNPNIVYSQWQYGGLIRFDKKTGESLDIKPTSPIGSGALKWNWDAPLLISRHNHNKLYFAANKVFSSENMGSSWKLISGDLSRGIDRNTLPVMGKVWGLDAVVKNQSTSIYGNITGLSEGQKKGILYACTDDGLTYVTMNDGETWTKMSEVFPNGPAAAKNGAGYPFVSMIQAGKNANTVYAVLDHHRFGDFQPYVYKSTDNGITWVKITTGLPENGPVKCVMEDELDSDIVLVGTEFGLFISINGGSTFIQWTGGLPPTPIKDMVHQSRANDLVVATFGRGFAVCDDYDRIHQFKNNFEVNNQTKILLPTTAKLFIPSSPLGGSGNGYKGASRFMAPNPTEKAVLYYYINKEYPSIKSRREKKESENSKNANALIYPSKDSILAEVQEVMPKLFVSVYSNYDNAQIKNLQNKLIARWSIPASKGWSKTEWNMKYSIQPVILKTDDKIETNWGPYVNPGTYSIVIEEFQKGKYTSISTPVGQVVEYLFEPTIPLDKNRDEKITKMGQVRTMLEKSENKLALLKSGFNAIQQNIVHYSNSGGQYEFYETFQKELNSLNIDYNGNPALAAKEFETEEGIASKFWNAYYQSMDALNAPTETHYQVFSDVEKHINSNNLIMEMLKIKYLEFKNAQTNGSEMPLMW